MNTKDIRKLFGLTQKQLAKILGIKVKKVQNWDQRNSMDDLVHFLTKLQLIDLQDDYEIRRMHNVVVPSFAEYAAAYMNYIRREDENLPELEEEE